MRKLGVTQELLSLVTGLAHYLKLLIRISLQGALKLERERRTTEGLNHFLKELSNLESVKDVEQPVDITAGVAGLADRGTDLCASCQEPIDDECAKLGQLRWHREHLHCQSCQRNLASNLIDAMWSGRDQILICRQCMQEKHQSTDAIGGMEQVTRLKQYIYLLGIARARLLSLLRSGGTLPHTSGTFTRTKRGSYRT